MVLQEMTHDADDDAMMKLTQLKKFDFFKVPFLTMREYKSPKSLKILEDLIPLVNTSSFPRSTS